MKHVLIINQHGENRGDEAAMRAMLRRFEEELGAVGFTILYQFRDRALRPVARQEVKCLPIVLPPIAYVRAALFSLGVSMGLRPTFLLPPIMRQMIEAYESADLVVSAPGGPYFGDLYAGHEMVHWWYVWLAHRLGKALVLYAPSAGPFRNRVLNRLRQKMYRMFDVVVTREEISRAHLVGLLGEEIDVHVTADSALQTTWEPLARNQYFLGDRSDLARKTLVAVSLLDFAYPGSANAMELRSRYITGVSSLLRRFAAERECHFLFVPQLMGDVHDDTPFLRQVALEHVADLSVEIVDRRLDSDFQQQLFAMCDFHVASRYHPAIFGHAGGVPGICIYYEHKALGFMRQLGLENFAFDIRRVDPMSLAAAASELVRRSEEIRAHLATVVPGLRARARRTTELAVSVIP